MESFSHLSVHKWSIAAKLLSNGFLLIKPPASEKSSGLFHYPVY
jgi:hypothetical protein